MWLKSMAKDKSEDEAKKNQLSTLKSRLSVAKAYEDKQRKWWKRVLKTLDFEQEVTVGGTTNTYKIKYPLLWAAYENYIAQLTSTPPQIVIEAEGKEDALKKLYWKGILDYTKRKIRLEDLKDTFIESFVTTGKAVYKVGRVVETKSLEKSVKGPDGETVIKGEPEEHIVKNETFVENVHPAKIWLAPETIYEGPILGEKCPYVIEEMVKLPEYLYETYGIKCNEDEKERISPDEFDTDTKKSERIPDENQDDMKRVRLYAYYGVWRIDGKFTHKAEVLFTSKRIIKQREIPYHHGKKPYIYLLAFKKLFKPIAHAPLNSVLDLDMEYNENENRKRTYIRRMVNPKWAKLQGTQIDEDALLDPDIGNVVEESQANSFRPVTPPPLDSSVFNKSETVEQLFQLLAGIVYGQQSLNKAGTATGQNMVSNAVDVKMGRLVRLNERADEELNKMIIQLEQQHAPTDGVDIRIVGADMVKMIRDKKTLHQTSVKLYERQQQQLQSGKVTAQDGVLLDEKGMSIGKVIDQPIDEYDMFQLSEDGRSVYTTYTREDIQGEFELTVVSQSSNRSNRVVKAQQAQNSLDSSASDPTVNRAELWKRKFSLDGWDDPENLVNSNPGQPVVPGLGSGQPSLSPNETAMTSNIGAQANKVV